MSLGCYFEVSDSSHAALSSLFESKINILSDKAIGRDIGENAKHFVFDLTCDVIGDPEANTIHLLWRVFPGLSDAVCGFKIGSVVAEIRVGWGGGVKIAPPLPVTRVVEIPQ